MTKRTSLKQANLLLEIHLKELGISYMPEMLFCDGRGWRFDYWIGRGLAIEIEGGVYAQGRHTRGAGFEADCEKYNTATMMGYRVLRFSTGQVLRGEAKAFLAEWMGK